MKASSIPAPPAPVAAWLATPRVAARAVWLTLLASLVALAAVPAAADNLRCRGRLVGDDALKAEVLAACGEPAYIDRWPYAHPRQGGGNAGDVEDWYYNFGPNQLLRILRFRGARLQSVESDGYGYAQRPDGSCHPNEVVAGLSKFRLVMLCGEPVSRESSHVLAAVRDRERHGDWWIDRDAGYGNARVEVYREEWVYNFGSSFLLREVTLENGRVVSVDSGSRGFDPR